MLMMTVGLGVSACGSSSPPPTIDQFARPSGTPAPFDAAGRAAVIAAATSGVEAVLDYDYHHLERDKAAALSHATRAFGTTYAGEFSTLSQNAVLQKSSITVDVKAIGVSAFESDRASVIAFLDQTGRQSAGPGQVVRNFVQVAMAKVHGRWLVDGMDPGGRPRFQDGAANVLAVEYAASDFNKAASTYSAGTVDAFASGLEAITTGSYRASLPARLDAMRAKLLGTRLASAGDTTSVGVVALTAEAATVLVAGESMDVTPGSAHGKTLTRWRLELQRVNGKWLVADATAV